MSNCQCTAAYYLPDENQYEPGYTCEECREKEFVNQHLVDENKIDDDIRKAFILEERIKLKKMLQKLDNEELPF